MNPDEQAIDEIVKRMEAAWNLGDGAGFAAPFADDATFTHIYGGRFEGRAEIGTNHQQVFDTVYKGSRSAFTLSKVRFIRPDIAIGLVEVRVTIQAGVAAREILAHPSFVAAKENGNWRLVHFQNTPVSQPPGTPPAAAHHDR
jgi:uncharacterized protein (TIGR02246 family)